MDTRQALMRVGTIVRDGIRRRIRGNRITPRGRKKGGTTLVDSGGLVQSIRREVVGRNEVRVGTDVKYAKIHNEGGVIRPRRAKFLAIPLCPEAKAKSPREFDNTFIHKGVIMQRVADGKPRALYVLKASVTMPKREFLKVTPDDERRIRSVLGELARGLFATGVK